VTIVSNIQWHEKPGFGVRNILVVIDISHEGPIHATGPSLCRIEHASHRWGLGRLLYDMIPVRSQSNRGYGVLYLTADYEQ
jgi:hypothetical protein